jgi:shikimate dehydrogenase
MKLALLGHPVAHSKSPLIHNYWLRKYGLHGLYEALDVAPDDLAACIGRLALLGYKGFNITVPHKKNALQACNTVDDLTRALGAVNTITIRAGKLAGTNTDVFGFIENLRTARPEFDFKAGPAAVLGAGGAARAVVHGLVQEGAPEIRIIARDPRAAEELSSRIGGAAKTQIFAWENCHDALGELNLLVNTTPLGMEGQPPLGIDLAGLPLSTTVNDIVYAPLWTELLQRARWRDNPVVTGLGMLVHQARAAFAFWTGIMPEYDRDLEEMLR